MRCLIVWCAWFLKIYLYFYYYREYFTSETFHASKEGRCQWWRASHPVKAFLTSHSQWNWMQGQPKARNRQWFNTVGQHEQLKQQYQCVSHFLDQWHRSLHNSGASKNGTYHHLSVLYLVSNRSRTLSFWTN